MKVGGLVRVEGKQHAGVGVANRGEGRELALYGGGRLEQVGDLHVNAPGPPFRDEVDLSRSRYADRHRVAAAAQFQEDQVLQDAADVALAVADDPVAQAMSPR